DDMAPTPVRDPRRAVGGWISRIAAGPAVLHPLPHIAVHVVQAESTGGKRADRSRPLKVPLATTAVTVGISLAELVAPGIGRRGPGARRIFPFGLGEQAIRLPGPLRQPRHVLLGVVPTPEHPRPRAAAPAGLRRRPGAATEQHAGIPLLRG